MNASNTNADSTAFIDFILEIILRGIKKNIAAQNRVTAKVSANQRSLLQAVRENPCILQGELSVRVGISLKSIKENMRKLQDSCRLRRVGARWKLPIVWYLTEEDGLHYNELRRRVQGITDTALARNLHELEDDGIITRHDAKTMPLSVT